MDKDHPSLDTRPTLIQRVSALDPESWNEFIKLYDQLLRAYVGDCDRRYQFGLDHYNREEIKQDVLIKLFNELPSFNLRGRFRSWLWRVTHNVVIDWVRAQRGRSRPPIGPDGSDSKNRPPGSEAAQVRPLTVHFSPELSGQLASDECPPDEQLIQDHLWQVRRHILEKVKAEMQSAQKWECFEMHFLDNKPSTEVAAQLGLSVSAVNTYTSRVLARIRDLCREYEVEL